MRQLGLVTHPHSASNISSYTGVSGVTAVKNLAEQGFDVVGYERNNHIGGLWHYHEDPSQTTVLKSESATTGPVQHADGLSHGREWLQVLCKGAS